MFTIQTKVSYPELYDNQDFLLFIKLSDNPYQALTKAESGALLEILNRYPKVFTEPFIRAWDDPAPLIDAKDATKGYNFSMNDVFEIFSDEDKDKLELIGFISGFDQKYTADNI